MIQIEHLQCVTGCFKSPTEDTPTFVNRLINSMELVSDEIFYSLSKDTQVWVNKKVIKIIRRKYE